MPDIIWTSPAFRALENLPQAVAFGIIRQTDLLRAFPMLGPQLELPGLQIYRQLIHRRRYRVLYEYDEFENNIYILAIQDCRQQFPQPRDLKRETDESGELPLE